MKLNKYFKWYNQIIDTALVRKDNDKVYYESHHIIPKSLGGSNDKNNLVNLTAREHFICHCLLTKFLENGSKAKMVYALNMMGVTTNNKRYINSFLYENNRITKSNIMMGDGNPMFGKNHKDSTKQKMSISGGHRLGEKHTLKTKTLQSKNQNRPWKANNFKKVDIFKNADVIYKAWLNENKIGNTKLARIFLLTDSEASGLIKYFREHGNPLDDKEFLLFINN